MAGVIQIQLGLSLTNGNLKVNVPTQNVSLVQAGSHSGAAVVDVTTTAAALVFPSGIATAGYGYFQNLDPTNYLQLGVEVSSTFYPLVQIPPLGVALIPLATLTVYAKANTATCQLLYNLLEA